MAIESNLVCRRLAFCRCDNKSVGHDDRQQDRNKHLGQLPIRSVRTRKRLNLGKQLWSHSTDLDLQCDDDCGFIAELPESNNGNGDDVATMAVVSAVVTIAVLLCAEGYLTLASSSSSSLTIR